MLKGEKFDAFALEAMSRTIYAFCQMYLCFQSNEFLLAVKCQYDCNQILFDTKDSYTTIISNEISLSTFSF